MKEWVGGRKRYAVVAVPNGGGDGHAAAHAGKVKESQSGVTIPEPHRHASQQNHHRDNLWF